MLKIITIPINWFRSNLLVLLIVAVCASLVISYIIIDGSPSGVASLGIKPKRMLVLLEVNVGLIAFIISIIATRIYRLWAMMRAGTGGSRLQKRIVIMFSLVTITPAIIVSIFSALFFNIGIESWFNERAKGCGGIFSCR